MGKEKNLLEIQQFIQVQGACNFKETLNILKKVIHHREYFFVEYIDLCVQMTHQIIKLLHQFGNINPNFPSITLSKINNCKKQSS
ncbi:hypothetical protein AALA52_00720 [Lactococcus ileimucosae]|uniref:Uncharacterized protein n=1 Tax=Lactococcus ileimucosae TaxID=2941329 RepID=A0ABV4D0Y5_9LACT